MDYSFLAKTVLFCGISIEEIEIMLKCLNAKQRCFAKGSFIYRAGETADSMGLVLFGSIYIENNDIWGNKSILDCIDQGKVFAETYTCIPGEPLMVNVVAAKTTSILFLNTSRLLKTCTNVCSCHNKLIENLLTIFAQKNLNLSRRIFHTSSKTIRGRLLSYFSFQSVRQGSYKITIPFNRQQLADYLGVDRSALSNELSKMQRDGLLTYKKNKFFLKETSDKLNSPSQNGYSKVFLSIKE